MIPTGQGCLDLSWFSAAHCDKHMLWFFTLPTLSTLVGLNFRARIFRVIDRLTIPNQTRCLRLLHVFLSGL